ncbi:MAG: peptidylprolyl isomerase [Planctomycetes bacterium]|nr:peptidylprolyl isomerase [Planctomycetota bacterium]MCB9916902.1 peptidylprolyl isomerase [Planctomycetota bacterium]
MELQFSLPGFDVKSPTLKVVPDVRDVDLGSLDLAKTKVALVTDFGTMVIGFRPDKAPKTVENFVKLSQSGFYDGTYFHRVIKGFMIQGGDPNTKDDNPANDGQGDPGYKIDAEFNDMKHERGVLSMARSNDPNSAGSQFFVMHGMAPHLDNNYTAFGKLTEGLDVLDRIANVDVARSGGGMEVSSPVEKVWLRRAIVLPVMKGN